MRKMPRSRSKGGETSVSAPPASVSELPSRETPVESERLRRVLVIEDHPGLAEATCEFLGVKGFDVRVASSGREALQVAAMFSPEIVLCDMSLPDMNGADVAQALRTSPSTHGALLAIFSARGESEIRALGQLPAVNIVLSKPLTEEKVRRLIAAFDALRPSV